MSIYLSFTPVKSQKECCPKDPKIPKTKNTSLHIESKQDTRCLPLNSSHPFKLILFFFQHFHKPQLLLFLAFLPDRLSELFPFLPPLIQVYLWACFIFEGCDIITQTWAIATCMHIQLRNALQTPECIYVCQGFLYSVQHCDTADKSIHTWEYSAETTLELILEMHQTNHKYLGNPRLDM